MLLLLVLYLTDCVTKQSSLCKSDSLPSHEKRKGVGRGRSDTYLWDSSLNLKAQRPNWTKRKSREPCTREDRNKDMELPSSFLSSFWLKLERITTIKHFHNDRGRKSREQAFFFFFLNGKHTLSHNCLNPMYLISTKSPDLHYNDMLALTHDIYPSTQTHTHIKHSDIHLFYF